MKHTWTHFINSWNQFWKHPTTKNAWPYIEFLLIGAVLWFIPDYREMDWIKLGTATTLANVMIFTIVALGFSVLMGYSGLVSLGTAGFMGLGAYGIAYFTVNLGIPFEIAFFLSLIVPLAVGLIVGLVSLRIEGMYLAIATLGVSEVLKKSFIEAYDITRGPSGYILNNYMTVFGTELDRWSTIRMIVVVLVIAMILIHTFTKSYVGRALLTMRGSEAAAQAMGVHLIKYKLMAFAFATVYAAVGGILYMSLIRFTAPSDWDILLSLNVLAIIVVGGVRSIKGILVGSFIIYAFPTMVLNELPVVGEMYGFSYIFSGVILVLVLIFYPGGAAHLGVQLKSTLIKWTKKGISLLKGRGVSK